MRRLRLGIIGGPHVIELAPDAYIGGCWKVLKDREAAGTLRQSGASWMLFGKGTCRMFGTLMAAFTYLDR